LQVSVGGNDARSPLNTGKAERVSAFFCACEKPVFSGYFAGLSTAARFHSCSAQGQAITGTGCAQEMASPASLELDVSADGADL
jgi:hypothetical protein